LQSELTEKTNNEAKKEKEKMEKEEEKEREKNSAFSQLNGEKDNLKKEVDK